jgi:hypothetical protein
MRDKDLVKCPLCGGLSELQRTELLAALDEEDLVDRLKRSLNASAPVARQEPAGSAGGAVKPRDFAKDVHTWNPGLPMWTRSPKE